MRRIAKVKFLAVTLLLVPVGAWARPAYADFANCQAQVRNCQSSCDGLFKQESQAWLNCRIQCGNGGTCMSDQGPLDVGPTASPTNDGPTDGDQTTPDDNTNQDDGGDGGD